MSVQLKGSGTIGGLDEGLVISGIVTSSTQINVGSNIKIGNAGVVTATSFVGSGANLTGIAADKIFEGNTEAEVVDTGSDGHFKVTTEGTERLRIGSNGSVGIGTDYLSGNNSVYHKLMVEGDTTSQLGVVKIVRKHSSASNSTYTLEVDSSSHTSNVTNAGAMSVDVNSGRAFTIDGNGKVGIGTNNPHVTGLTLSGANARFQLISPTTGGGSGDGVIFGLNGDQDFFINNRETSKNILFFTEATEKARIASGGQVIIGDDDTDKANAHFDDLIVGANASTTETHGITIVCGNAATNGGIAFSDGSNGGADAYRGMISYQHNDNHMQFRTNGTERVRIDANGYVTKPNHPSFSAHTTGTQNANTDIVFGAAVTAIGSHYNTSNGRFTAPVAGNYFFSFHGMGPHATSQNGRCYFRINGAAHGGGQHYGGVAYAGGHSGGYTHLSMSTILPLSANDYVTVYWQYMQFHSEHNKFNGFLIG